MEEKKEESQAQTESTQGSKGVLFKYVLAAVFVFFGLWAVIGWWSALVTLVKGALGIILLLAGVITFAIAKE